PPCPTTSRDVAYSELEFMSLIDEPGEWLRLSDHYRHMTDGELIKIASDRDQLTEIAQQILAMELSARRLKLDEVNPRSPKVARMVASPSPGELRTTQQPKAAVPMSGDDESCRGTAAADRYAEDRKLVRLLTVWSLRDALQVQHLLDVASIPFYM